MGVLEKDLTRATAWGRLREYHRIGFQRPMIASLDSRLETQRTF